MDRLPCHVAAAVAAQRTKDLTFLGILLVNRFPAPGVRYPTAQFHVVFGTNFQGRGPQQTFIVFYQGGVDLDGDPLDLTNRNDCCHCKGSDTILDIGPSRDPIILQWLDRITS